MFPARLPGVPLLESPACGWPGIALRQYRHPPGGAVDVSHHDHVLVVHRSAGTPLEERLDGSVRRALAAPGRISLTPAGQTVSRQWHRSSEVLLLVVGRTLVDDAARDLGADPDRVHLEPRLAAPDGDVDRIGHLLFSQAAQPGRGVALMVETLARALALRLVQRHSSLSAPHDTLRPSLPPRRIARVIDYMRAKLDQPITVPELATVAGLSPSHLTRAFRDALGTTPYAYLTGLRLERACALLATGERSITEIAFSCGFEQSQHFATTFRRRFGAKPSEWRRAI